MCPLLAMQHKIIIEKKRKKKKKRERQLESAQSSTGATVYCRLVSAIGPLLWVHWVSGIRASDRYFEGLGLESVTEKEKCCMFTGLWSPQ